jgi:hypothetical protein
MTGPAPATLQPRSGSFNAHRHIAGDFLDMTQDREASAHLTVRYRFIHPKLLTAQEVRVSSISVFGIGSGDVGASVLPMNASLMPYLVIGEDWSAT